MKTLIIDDEQSNVENLSNLIREYCPRLTLVGTANNVSQALQQIAAQQPDLLLLDIHMGKETGFDLLRLLPTKDFEVIFVTAFNEYGIDAIKFAAVDYLLKPVDIAELVLAVNKAEEKIATKQTAQQLNFLLNHLKSTGTAPAKIALPQLHEIRYVSVSDIIRCEADNSYTHFFLSSFEKILVSKSLKEYAEMLTSAGFLRTHQSHLVNKIFIKSWIKEDGGMLLLNNGDKIPVSRPNKTAVQAALNHDRPLNFTRGFNI
ncbi:two-component system LytT family response regulator [Pedobacter africanus]|uniref:Two-component system LytT family response regulator n=1 Tax=Pedobacter africanus TaxID=151894 RepID=A0ACC6KZY3_9SPHI|nr:LytTR family DNA-binding domain-containing protein [Pedobacter africanus]MDR6784638.1 two-component system LytT family response regulator [Pedobacter africanus]